MRAGDKPMRMAVWRLGLIVALGGCGAGGCGAGGASDSPGPAAPVSPGDAAVKVTLTEGTNMAVALNPINAERVISLQGALFLLPNDGPAVQILGAEYDAREPQFAADGASIVFQGYSTGTWDIWQLELDGKTPTALTNDGSPAISARRRM